jgi:hypothetical protein
MLIELLKVDLEFAIESVGRFAFRLPSEHAGGYEFIIFFVNYCFDRVIVGVISLLIPDILIYSLFVSIFFSDLFVKSTDHLCCKLNFSV